MLYADYMRKKIRNISQYRTAIGYPCSFESSDNQILYDYRIYGSAGGVGDKTANLFDLSKINNQYYIVDNNEVTVTKYAQHSNIIPETFLRVTGLNRGDNVYTSRKLKFNGGISGVAGRIVFMAKSSENQSFTLIDAYYMGDENSAQIPENFSSEFYNPMIFYPSNNGNSVTFYDIMISREKTEYEPYGYRIPIWNSGNSVSDSMNLFNINKYQKVSKYIGFDISGLAIGEKYTFTSNIPIAFFKISNNTGGHNSVAKYDKNGFTFFTFTMSRNSNIAENITQYIFIGLDSMAAETDYSLYDGYKFAVFKGTYTSDTVPDYQPYGELLQTIYLPEPLYEGEYIDYRAQIIRKADGVAEPITLPPITVPQGNVVLTTNTAAASSKISVKYK